MHAQSLASIWKKRIEGMSIWPQKMFTKSYHVNSETSGEGVEMFSQGITAFEIVPTSVRSHPHSFLQLRLIRRSCRSCMSSLFLFCCGTKVAGETNWKVGTEVAIQSGEIVNKTGKSPLLHSLALAELWVIITCHHTHIHLHVAFARKWMTAFQLFSRCPFHL